MNMGMRVLGVEEEGRIWRIENSRVVEGSQVSSLGSRRVGGVFGFFRFFVQDKNRREIP